VGFVAAQILHVPVNAFIGSTFGMEDRPLLVQALILGLTAGLFEELARYIIYRFWRKDARSWRQAVFFGLGHGGIEALLTGMLVLLTLLNMMAIANVDDPATLELPQEALEQIDAFWGMPLYSPLLAVLERVMAITLHIALSSVVVLCFRAPHQVWPLLAAVLWHAFANAAAVYVGTTVGLVASEGTLFIIALLSAGILWLTHRALSGGTGRAEAKA
jgi:uncharacterized membrane protein YhfC